MKLTRKIPARTESFKVKWAAPFQVMSPTFRRVRERSKNKMDRCWWCKTPFNDGDKTVLACIDGKSRGNKLLCFRCGEPLLTERDGE